MHNYAPFGADFVVLNQAVATARHILQIRHDRAVGVDRAVKFKTGLRSGCA